MNRTRKSILIITDYQALADSLALVAQSCVPGNAVTTMTYARIPSELAARIPITDAFILGLFRQYPGGLRAEGVALAGILIPRGKRVLVISPLHIPALVDNPAYWDTASKKPLRERIRDIVEAPAQKTVLAPLQKCLNPLLDIPKQH